MQSINSYNGSDPFLYTNDTYIPVYPVDGQPITIAYHYLSTVSGLIEYDENKNFIRIAGKITGSEAKYKTITLDSNTRYIRLSVSLDRELLLNTPFLQDIIVFTCPKITLINIINKYMSELIYDREDFVSIPIGNFMYGMYYDRLTNSEIVDSDYSYAKVMLPKLSTPVKNKFLAHFKIANNTGSKNSVLMYNSSTSTYVSVRGITNSDTHIAVANITITSNDDYLIINNNHSLLDNRDCYIKILVNTYKFYTEDLPKYISTSNILSSENDTF